MHSRIGRRPARSRRHAPLAAAWAAIAFFLAALAAQASSQATHDHPDTHAACVESPADPGHRHDDHHQPGPHPCPVCEKSCLAKSSLATPPAPMGLRTEPAPATALAWVPQAKRPSRAVLTTRARGPPASA